MTEDELLDAVRDLRARGRSPVQIARALGVRPAEVAPVVRALAREQAATAPPPAVAGCWVSPGWSVGLRIDEHRGWRDHPDQGGGATSGLAGVLVARERRPGHSGRLSVCGYLVDTYCLGVKDAIGPRAMDATGLRRFVRRFFSAFDGVPLEAPVDLAQHLVWGAAAYARDLGFEPHPDFAAASRHLDPPADACPITFGHDGKPLYIEGPHDDSAKIMRTLQERAGTRDPTFLVTAPPPSV